MGLIGGVVKPLYVGFPVVILSPYTFLQQPFRWLQTITKVRATVTGGPNFAYDLCVRKVTPEQRERLEMSSWKIAFRLAEPTTP
jgi:acyl-CoA synthetase (AMP-forming)/AMP-acid ligase II